MSEHFFPGSTVIMVGQDEGGMVKGSACLTFLDNGTPGGALFLFMLLTRPEHRRQGIARRVVELAIAEAGPRDLYLQPLAWLDRAMPDEALRNWYKSMGFVEVEGDNLMAIEGNKQPHRIQLRRERNWRKPAGVVSCGRPTKWGNDWRAGDPHPETRAPMTREDAIALFRKKVEDDFLFRGEIQRELKGKVLACWCKLDEPCHVDVLLEIANEFRCHKCGGDTLIGPAPGEKPICPQCCEHEYEYCPDMRTHCCVHCGEPASDEYMHGLFDGY